MFHNLAAILWNQMWKLTKVQFQEAKILGYTFTNGLKRDSNIWKGPKIVGRKNRIFFSAVVECTRSVLNVMILC